MQIQVQDYADNVHPDLKEDFISSFSKFSNNDPLDSFYEDSILNSLYKEILDNLEDPSFDKDAIQHVFDLFDHVDEDSVEVRSSASTCCYLCEGDIPKNTPFTRYRARQCLENMTIDFCSSCFPLDKVVIPK